MTWNDYPSASGEAEVERFGNRLVTASEGVFSAIFSELVFESVE
jgi:hypothetical protein